MRDVARVALATEPPHRSRDSMLLFLPAATAPSGAAAKGMRDPDGQLRLGGNPTRSVHKFLCI